MSPFRSREIKRRVGASMTTDHVKAGVRAMVELSRFRKPKPMSHGHRRSLREHAENGTLGNEARFVLMEYREDGNRQLKAKMMTRLEARIRNDTLRGTGFAWALCDTRT